MVIQFPETVQAEWNIVADAANANDVLRKRLAHDTQVEKKVEDLRIRHEATLLFQQELDAEDTPLLEMVTLADFRANPAAAPVDMIDGVMKAEGLCTVLGPSGSGKSTLALQMVYSLMTGNDWLGRNVTAIGGGVGILSYDMDAAMLLDWMAGFPGVDPAKISVVNAYKRGNPVGVPLMRAKIAAAWRALNTEVVVLDSFSASFFGHDQNDAAATMAHYRDMKKFALTEVGAKALIVITHSSDANPSKVRGSTVHKDVADTMVVVQEDQSTGSRRVYMEKYRAARGQVQMDPVVITAPDDVTHLVEIDPGAMTLAGLPLPVGSAASRFTALPGPAEEPDTESDEEDEDV